MCPKTVPLKKIKREEIVFGRQKIFRKTIIIPLIFRQSMLRRRSRWRSFATSTTCCSLIPAANPTQVNPPPPPPLLLLPPPPPLPTLTVSPFTASSESGAKLEGKNLEGIGFEFKVSLSLSFFVGGGKWSESEDRGLLLKRRERVSPVKEMEGNFVACNLALKLGVVSIGTKSAIFRKKKFVWARISYS